MKLSQKNTQDHSFHLIDENIFSITRQLINQTKKRLNIVIPHVCNNVNAFGAGFADALSSQYPVVKANFHVNGAQKLGHTQFIEGENFAGNKIIVANMIAQNGLINHKNKRPLHYPSLVKCMYLVRDFVKQNSEHNGSEYEIHAPKFGSGLAGGNWNFIADLIDDIWSGIDTYVYFKK